MLAIEVKLRRLCEVRAIHYIVHKFVIWNLSRIMTFWNPTAYDLACSQESVAVAVAIAIPQRNTINR